MSDPAPKEPWHQSKGFLVVAILILGPLALPLIWVNKKVPLPLKIVFSAALIGMTMLLIQATGRMIGQLQSQLAEINQIRRF